MIKYTYISTKPHIKTQETKIRILTEDIWATISKQFSIKNHVQVLQR
jgi:hypothetical protein